MNCARKSNSSKLRSNKIEPIAVDSVSSEHMNRDRCREGGSPLKPSQRASIERFIRDVLGCTCPDEVFQTICIDRNPPTFTGIGQQAHSIAVGGRLLILVIVVTNWPALGNELGGILQRGRQLRDHGGFNRFRLVVATPDQQSALPVLVSQFESLASQDNLTHLHVVSPDQLPNIESSPSGS